MTTLDFGKQLRIFRLKCSEPNNAKSLSQQKLGEILCDEMGVRYSGAAVSDWERGKSKIAADDRLVLISLVKILKRHGGIKTIDDANLLLEDGNYRALNKKESTEIFPEELREIVDQSPNYLSKESGQLQGRHDVHDLIFIIPPEFQRLLNEASEGPQPVWPRVVITLIKKATNQWSIHQILIAFIWLWIWLLTYLLIAPSLQWPLPMGENGLRVMVLYAGGTIILPPFIGAIVNTNTQIFWKERGISNALSTRLYVHQGAYIGFHVGYFILFPLALIQGLLSIQSVAWVEFTKMIVPLVLSYIGAQLIPYNLWRAYGRLTLSNGKVFFIFTLLGPMWAWYFLEFHKTIPSPFIGTIFILTVATVFVLTQAIKNKKNKPPKS